MLKEDEMHSPCTWDIFKPHLLIWKFFGFLPPPYDHRKPCSLANLFRLLYLLHAAFLNITVTLMFPTSLVVSCLLSDNLNAFSQSLCITITDISCNLKFLNILLVCPAILKLQPILSYLDSRSRSMKERQSLQDGIDSARRVFFMFATICCIACITSQLVSFFAHERNLMYPAWFPWNWRSSQRNFRFAHGYQTYCLQFQAVMALTSDTYPQACMVTLRAHIKALGVRICEIGLEAQHELKKRSDFECKQQYTIQEEEELFQKLISCIEDHKVVIKLSELICFQIIHLYSLCVLCFTLSYSLFGVVQRSISRAAMLQFFATCLGQCAIGIYLLYLGFDVYKLLNTLIIFAAVTMEIFLLCYYGDALSQENALLADAIYSCKWPDQSKRFKMALQMLLQRAQRTDVIMAGKLLPLRLPTFLRVIKTAYSVFTVLSHFK